MGQNNSDGDITIAVIKKIQRMSCAVKLEEIKFYETATVVQGGGVQ